MITIKHDSLHLNLQIAGEVLHGCNKLVKSIVLPINNWNGHYTKHLQLLTNLDDSKIEYKKVAMAAKSENSKLESNDSNNYRQNHISDSNSDNGSSDS